ncbi:hypothetical protein F5Y06DRAFT_276684 [Hypoxylon sp. FL0890]|nr:hypothetical protein F5Y06DRAFT_276684 [Hypoxylon sp. FL0890]
MSVSASSTARPPSTVPTSVTSEHNNEDPTVKFTNTQDLFQVIDSISGDFLIVTDVSPSNFARIEEQRTIRRRKVRWRRYHAESRILIITIPTRVHEFLHSVLYEKFRDHVSSDDWATIAGTTFYTSRPGGGCGEGDSTGGPIPQRDGRDKWPTLVIEAGYSESLNQLHMDMQWWFTASNHDVKIVMLAKFDRRQRRIILEKWEEEAATRPGATTTRRAAALQPNLQQTITIHRNETTSPISYNVTRGALILEFRLLFLRDPGPQERDVVISVSVLQWYAARVWAQF